MTNTGQGWYSTSGNCPYQQLVIKYRQIISATATPNNHQNLRRLCQLVKVLDCSDNLIGRHSTLHTDLETLLDEAQQQGLIERAVLSHTDTQYRAMWSLREAIPLAEKTEGHMVKHDIAVPTSLVPAFVEQAQAALQRLVPGCRIVCFGHLGDGNLHYNVQAPVNMDTEVFLAQNEAAIHALVYDLALSLGGTISAEHGIGQLKRVELGQRQSATRTAWMRAIKHALDPEDRFNPGRLVP